MLFIFCGEGVCLALCLWYAPNWVVCTGGTLLYPRAGLIRAGAVGNSRVEGRPWQRGRVRVRVGGPGWVIRDFASSLDPLFAVLAGDTSLPHDRSIEKRACAVVQALDCNR